MLEELLDLEHQGWKSLCHSTGANFYGRIMTRDGDMILAHGQVFDRQAVVGSLNDPPPWRTYDITDERLMTLSGDHVILVYTGRAYRDEDERSEEHTSELQSRGHLLCRLLLENQDRIRTG